MIGDELCRLGVCYYPEHWDESIWASDAQRMREAGITRVRIGEFAWSRIEPEPGLFAWDWLDRAIATLADEGLGIILGTPTATPPKWLVDRMPDMVPLDSDGRPRGFGSRRHYDFSHEGYRGEALRITREVATRYGRNPAIVAWQTDNEYGCHDTVISYSSAARAAFRDWLANRYQSIDALNAAWGNVFWSMEYRSFEEVELPNLTVTEANPAHWLAFRRFSSDQVIAFNRAQVAILRRLSPGRDITHNAMGFFTDFDHHALGRDVDVLGWDSYPLGFLEQFRFDEDVKIRYARQGHPDIAAFHHDLYRGCCAGERWTVLEQQPGPVNWARHNPAPLAGMVKLWTLEAAAHGAEMVSYFRWRQAPFGQEQMHAGLLRPDSSEAPGLAEAREAGELLRELGPLGAPARHAALVFDYAAEWITAIQPQGQGCSALWAAFACYSALRRLGCNVDILPSSADLSAYKLVVIPCLPIVSGKLADHLDNHPGAIVVGPRTGSRDEDFAIPEGLPPGPLAALVGGRVVRSESLRPGLTSEGDGWRIARWLDELSGAAEPEFVASDGRVAGWRHGRVRYCAAWPEGDFIDRVIEAAARDAGLPVNRLGEGVRQFETARYRFRFDYTSAQVHYEPLG